MNNLIDLGNDLVKYAEHEAEFTAQRGLLDELFPFIYVASRRMSLRAICRWLKETQDIQISVNTLSKAMRKQEDYWADIADEVASSVRIFAEAHDADPILLLKEREYFAHMEMSDVQLAYTHGASVDAECRRIATAAGVLRNRWFSLPEEAREQCYRHFAGEFTEEETETQEGGKDSEQAISE